MGNVGRQREKKTLDFVQTVRNKHILNLQSSLDEPSFSGINYLSLINYFKHFRNVRFYFFYNF